MTETPTEDAAKNRSGGVHLPVLPDGWHYAVQLIGPASLGVEIRPVIDGETDEPSPAGVVGSGHRLAIHTGRGEIRHAEVGSLAEALRTGAQTARTLRDLTVHEAKAVEAREKLLAGIGQPSPRQEDGTLATPASLDEAKGRGKLSTGGPETQTNAEESDA